MSEMDYKPNSHKYKEEQKSAPVEKRVEPVVSRAAKTRKKSEIRKMTDVFISEDARNVKSYVFMDVLVPAIKKAIVDIIVDGANMIFYGSTARGKKRSSGDYVSYGKYSDRSRSDYRREEPRRQDRFDYEDIIFESRGEAEAARAQMDEVVDKYGFVTVADMYDMAELSCPYTANKYGWTSIRSAEVLRTRDGYVLKLPKAMPVEK